MGLEAAGRALSESRKYAKSEDYFSGICIWKFSKVLLNQVEKGYGIELIEFFNFQIQIHISLQML